MKMNDLYTNGTYTNDTFTNSTYMRAAYPTNNYRNVTYTPPKLTPITSPPKMPSSHKTEIILIVCVSVGLLCIGMVIYVVIRRKRTIRNIEAGSQSYPSDEDLSRLSSRSTAHSGSGSHRSGYDADVSASDEERLGALDSRYLSTIPEERLSQLGLPESSLMREVIADRAAGSEPDRAD